MRIQMAFLPLKKENVSLWKTFGKQKFGIGTRNLVRNVAHVNLQLCKYSKTNTTLKEPLKHECSLRNEQ